MYLSWIFCSAEHPAGNNTEQSRARATRQKSGRRIVGKKKREKDKKDSQHRAELLVKWRLAIERERYRSKMYYIQSIELQEWGRIREYLLLFVGSEKQKRL